MKTSPFSSGIALIVGLCFFGLPRLTAAQAQEASPDTLLSPAQWVAFEDNLTLAIRDGNDGVKQGALRQIVRYGDYLDMNRLCVFDVMRIYRNHKDEHMRRLAVLALGNMNDRWAIEFLDMLEPFEKSTEIRQTMKAVIDTYWESHGGYPYS